MSRILKTEQCWTIVLWPGVMIYVFPLTERLKWGYQCGKGFCAVDAFGLGPIVILWTCKHRNEKD